MSSRFDSSATLKALPAQIALVALLACSSTETSGAQSGSPKVMRYAFEIAETGFDPAQISDIYSRDVAREIFDAPLRYAYLAPAGTLEPNSAAALPDASADFRTFTVRIKPGIYFTPDAAFKGVRRELTAADYVYSYKRIYDPRWKSFAYGSWEQLGVVGMQKLRDAAQRDGRFDYDRPVEGLKVVDRYTFQVRLEHPEPRFPYVLADSSLFGAVAREVVEFYGDRIMEHPVGTGGFRLAEWRRSSRIVLERNPDYREDIFHGHPAPADANAKALAAQLEGRRMPMLDRVEISIIEESQPRWLAFLNGELDVLERMPRDLAPLALTGDQPTPMLQRLGVLAQRVPEIDVTMIVYNMEHPVIGGYTPERIALRRALNLALDVDEMVRSIYKFQAFPAQSMVMPGTYGYDASWRTEMGSFDRARANALLDVYGYRRGADGWRTAPDGAPLTLEMNTEPDQRSRLVDEIAQKSFDAIGVHTQFKTAKWPENLKLVQAGQYMCWLLGWSATEPDSGETLRQAYTPSIPSENLTRFSRPEYDRLFREQLQLANGPQRLALLQRMNEMILAYAPLKSVVHRYKIDLNFPWVLGFHEWPFVKDWWRYVDIDTEMQARARR
jgi:ABC-type transport system substrate-binding protein